MKLTYSILWLDDKIEELFVEDEYHEQLNRYLAEQGFNPNITTVSTEDDFFKLLDSSYDLIMTDYHLKDKEGETRNGDVIVKSIRDQSIFTEILFYSARGDLKDTYKLDRITFVETSKKTMSHQEALLDASKKLIDLTIKKFQHIVTMRGMIMHETSSLDETTFEIINQYLGQTNDESLTLYILDSIISFHSEKLEQANKYKKNSSIDKVLNDPVMLSSSQRANAVGKIIELNGLKQFIDDFKTEVIRVRNQFAHAVLDKDKNGREFFRNKTDGVTFDEGLCKSIRENINKHKLNLDNLIGELSKI